MKTHFLSEMTLEPGKPIPYFEGTLPAGFPSPADDYLEKQLDLHDHLVKHPAATFFIRVEGDSMEGAGIFSGDLLIVDRSLKPEDRKIVVALIDGEFTVKRLQRAQGKIYLAPENPRYPQIEVKEESDFQIWGVVTYVVHQCTR